MLVRVIYKDQTAGVVEKHLLEGLIKKGRVVAYHREDRWISVVNGKYANGCGGSAPRLNFRKPGTHDAG